MPFIYSQENKRQGENGWTTFSFRRSLLPTVHTTAFSEPLLLGAFTTKFVLVDELNCVFATSTLYRLLPSKDFLYVIRDPQKTVGYLQVKNWRLDELFSPLETTLYDIDGIPILEGKYPLGSLSFQLHIPETKECVLEGKKRGALVEINRKNIDIFGTMPPALFFSLLQMHASKYILSKSLDWSSSSGSIDINSLPFFSQSPESISSKNALLETEENTDANEKNWLQLQEELRVSEAHLSLDDREKNQIIQNLADRLPMEGGKVFPENVFAILDELTEAEKTVLLQLLSTRLERVGYK